MCYQKQAKTEIQTQHTRIMRNPLLALAQLNNTWSIRDIYDETVVPLTTAGVRNVASYTYCFEDVVRTLRVACFRAVPGSVVVRTTTSKVYMLQELFHGFFKDQSVRRFERVQLSHTKDKPVLGVLCAPKVLGDQLGDQLDTSKLNLACFQMLSSQVDLPDALQEDIQQAVRESLALVQSLTTQTYEHALYAYRALERKHSKLLDLQDLYRKEKRQVPTEVQTWWADVEQRGGTTFKQNWYNKDDKFDFQFVTTQNTISPDFELASQYLFASRQIRIHPSTAQLGDLCAQNPEALTNFTDSLRDFVRQLKASNLKNNPRWVKGLDAVLSQLVSKTQVEFDDIFLLLALVRELKTRALPKNPFAKPRAFVMSPTQKQYLGRIQQGRSEPCFSNKKNNFQLNLLGFEQALAEVGIATSNTQSALDKTSSVTTHQAFCCEATRLVQDQHVNLYVKLVNSGFLVVPPLHEPSWPTVYTTLRPLEGNKCAIDSIVVAVGGQDHACPSAGPVVVNKTEAELEALLAKALRKMLLVVFVFGGGKSKWDDNVDTTAKNVMSTTCALEVQVAIDKINKFVKHSLTGDIYQAVLLFSKAPTHGVAQTLLELLLQQGDNNL